MTWDAFECLDDTLDRFATSLSATELSFKELFSRKFFCFVFLNYYSFILNLLYLGGLAGLVLLDWATFLVILIPLSCRTILYRVLNYILSLLSF